MEADIKAPTSVGHPSGFRSMRSATTSGRRFRLGDAGSTAHKPVCSAAAAALTGLQFHVTTATSDRVTSSASETVVVSKQPAAFAPLPATTT